MLIILAEQKHAAFFHELDNSRISFEHGLTRKVLDFRRKAAGVINRAIDFQAVFLADHKVVVAVTGRSMNTAGAGFAGRGFFASFTDVELGFGIGFAAQRDVLAHH